MNKDRERLNVLKDSIEKLRSSGRAKEVIPCHISKRQIKNILCSLSSNNVNEIMNFFYDDIDNLYVYLNSELNRGKDLYDSFDNIKYMVEWLKIYGKDTIDKNDYKIFVMCNRER